jgi:hypothetical protein
MIRLICICPVSIFGAMLGACDRAVEQRTQAIREQNVLLDRSAKFGVMKEVRKRWTIAGDAWFGKFPDGSVIRLDSPTVSISSVKAGKPFCCNWLGEVTIIAKHFERKPTSPAPGPFVMKYDAVMESPGRYSITSHAGPEVAPAGAKEIALLVAAKTQGDALR